MRNIFSVVVLLLFLFISCKEKKQQASPQGGPAKSGPLSVEATVISPVSISESIQVTGTLLPYEATEIRPEISGRVFRGSKDSTVCRRRLSRWLATIDLAPIDLRRHMQQPSCEHGNQCQQQENSQQPNTDSLRTNSLDRRFCVGIVEFHVVRNAQTI